MYQSCNRAGPEYLGFPTGPGRSGPVRAVIFVKHLVYTVMLYTKFDKDLKVLLKYFRFFSSHLKSFWWRLATLEYPKIFSKRRLRRLKKKTFIAAAREKNRCIFAFLANFLDPEFSSVWLCKYPSRYATNRPASVNPPTWRNDGLKKPFQNFQNRPW